MRIGKANGQDWLRLGEAASVLGVSLNTLRQWSDAGHVRCYRSPGGHRRYRRSDLDAFLGAPASPHRLSERAADVKAGDTSVEAALSALVAAAARGTAATSCCIAVQEGDDVLRIAAVHGDGEAPPIGERLPISSLPVEAEVVHGRRRLHIPDVARTRLLARAVADEYCRKGLQGLLVLPMELRDGRMGVLRLGDSRGPHAFDLDAMSFAESLAHHAGVLLSRRPGPASTDDGATREAETHGPPLAEVERQPLPAGDGLEQVARAAAAVLARDAAVHCCTVYVLDHGRARALASSVGPFVEAWELDDLPPAAAIAGGGDLELVRRDDTRLAAAARARFFDARDITGVVLAPIRDQARTLGIIETGGVDPGALSRLAPAIRDVAALVSATLRAGEERAGLSSCERDLAVLEDAWLQDTSRLSAEAVLRGLVERLAAATRAPIVEIYTVEGDTARALVSYDGGRWDTAWEDVVLRLDRYPTSLRAVETGEVVSINGLNDDALDQEGRFSLERWGYQSHLSVPLVTGGRTLGLMDVYDYVPHDFSPDVQLARGLARIATATLSSERLSEQVRRRSRMVSELQALASLCAEATDPGKLVAAVAERLQAALDAASCQVFRLTPRGVLCIASHDRSGRDDAAVGLITDLSEYPTAVSTMNAKDVLVISTLEDERLTPAEKAAYRASGWASEICVPLVLGDRLSGLIDVLDSRARGFAEYADFMRSVAGMVSVALETARLQDELAHRRGDLASLASLGGLDVRTDLGAEALELLAAEIRLHLDAADCDVFALEGEGLRCLMSVDEGGRDDSVSTAPLDVDRFPATAQAVRSAEFVVVPDLDDPRLSNQERADMTTWGFRSEVCVPLVDEGRVCGLIDVFDGRPRDFAEHHEYLAAVGHVATRVVLAALKARKLALAGAATAEATDSPTEAESMGGVAGGSQG